MAPQLTISNTNLETTYGLYLTSFNVDFPKPRVYTLDITGRNGKLDYTNFYGSMTYDNRDVKATLERKYNDSSYQSIVDYFTRINGSNITIYVSNSPYYYKGRIQVEKIDTDLQTISVEITVDSDPTNYVKGG